MSKNIGSRGSTDKVGGRAARSGQFIDGKPGPGFRGVLREVLGPDGKVRTRIDREVVEWAIRESGTKK